jgi:L-rhamnose mutarotase
MVAFLDGGWPRQGTLARLVRLSRKRAGRQCPNLPCPVGRVSTFAEYKCLPAAVWPEVLAAITTANIRNCSIHQRKLPDAHHYLFSSFEYVGSDFAGDMARMAALPVIQQWWNVCKACHDPLPDRDVDSSSAARPPARYASSSLPAQPSVLHKFINGGTWRSVATRVRISRISRGARNGHRSSSRARS